MGFIGTSTRVLGLRVSGRSGFRALHVPPMIAENCRERSFLDLVVVIANPKGPSTRIVYTLGPMYVYREYFQAKVYTVWVHGSRTECVRSHKTCSGTLPGTSL